MARVRVVLVRPDSAVNVGATARIVRNYGLHGLDLVSPGDWRTVECWRTAWGAPEVLEEARVFTDLAAALAGSALVVAFTGRRGAIVPVLDVRDAASEAMALGDDENAAFVFGPETTGLTRGELALCGRLTTIPSHPGQPSLNLSHAVAVAAYEVFRAVRRPDPPSRRATHDEKEAMLSVLRDGLRRTSALPRVDAEGHFLEWRALFQRADLTPKEVRLLEHMARKMREEE